MAAKKAEKERIKKRSKSLVIVTACSSLFMLFCYAVYTYYSVSINLGRLQIALGVIGILLPFDTLIFLKKMNKFLTALCCIVICGFCLIFLTLVIITNIPIENEIPEDEESVVIVFGAHTNGLTPGKTLCSRLLTASEL